MTTFRNFLVISLFVLMPHLMFGDELGKSNSTEFSSTKKGQRLVRQLSVTEYLPSSEAEDNPCNFKALEKPNFDVSGRRISESKCQEYLWEIKNRDHYFKKDVECSAYREQQNKNKKQTIAFVPFIIGGRNAMPREFPHMGAVGWKVIKGTWMFLCGSSLINSKFLLTAAHCSKVSKRYPNLANRSPDIVRLGANNIADAAIDGITTINAEIQRIVVQPQYVSPKRYFDLAIIELKYDVIFSNFIQPACLWTKFETSSLGSKATVTGWGVVETVSATSRTSTELQVAEVDIFDSNVCDDLLKPSCNRLWCGLSDTQLCAGNLSGGVDACQGDSGGPLQVIIDLPSNSQGYMYYLIGVTSFGYGCAKANTPAVYTRISSFIDWIEDVVWFGKS